VRPDADNPTKRPPESSSSTSTPNATPAPRAKQRGNETKPGPRPDSSTSTNPPLAWLAEAGTGLRPADLYGIWEAVAERPSGFTSHAKAKVELKSDLNFVGTFYRPRSPLDSLPLDSVKHSDDLLGVSSEFPDFYAGSWEVETASRTVTMSGRSLITGLSHPDFRCHLTVEDSQGRSLNGSCDGPFENWQKVTLTRFKKAP